MFVNWWEMNGGVWGPVELSPDPPLPNASVSFPFARGAFQERLLLISDASINQRTSAADELTTPTLTTLLRRFGSRRLREPFREHQTSEFRSLTVVTIVP